jgi:hypothetical protein
MAHVEGSGVPIAVSAALVNATLTACPTPGPLAWLAFKMSVAGVSLNEPPVTSPVKLRVIEFAGERVIVNSLTRHFFFLEPERLEWTHQRFLGKLYGKR